MPGSALNLPAVIAHRGASGYAPENTLAAMRKAQQLGAQWVEFDVMLADGKEAIVIHDLSLQRTTNGRGQIAHTPYSKIKQLDAGSWFAPEFSQERIPTLVQLLACLAEQNLHINLEIKPVPGEELITTQQVLEILSRHWPSERLPPLISSSSLLCLRESRRLQSELLLGVIVHRWPAEWQMIAEELTCVSCHINHEILNAQRVEQIRQTGRHVLAYTVNQASLALQLFQWGVTAVFTDYPDVILKAWQEQQQRLRMKGKEDEE